MLNFSIIYKLLFSRRWRSCRMYIRNMRYYIFNQPYKRPTPDDFIRHRVTLRVREFFRSSANQPLGVIHGKQLTISVSEFPQWINSHLTIRNHLMRKKDSVVIWIVHIIRNSIFWCKNASVCKQCLIWVHAVSISRVTEPTIPVLH